MVEISLEKALELLETVQASENPTKCLLESTLSDSEVSSYISSLGCQFEKSDTNWKYSCYLFYLLMNVVNQLDKDSEQLNVSQLNAMLHAIQEASTHSLESCVKKNKNRISYEATNQTNEEYGRLVSVIRIFTKLFRLKAINSNSILDDSKLDYIIGVLSVISLKRNDKDFIEFVQMFNESLSMFPLDLVFKFLMMIKGFNGLSKDFQLLVHRELIRIIRSPDGFIVLCRNLLVKPNDSQIPIWQKYSMITNIFEAAINSKASSSMVDEVFKALGHSLKSDNRDIVGACVHVLKHLEAKENFKTRIHLKILNPLKGLAQPDALLNGAIIMEQPELEDLVDKLHILFSSSSMSSLPSAILAPCARLIFNLYAILPEDSSERKKLANVLVFFLSNRQKSELQSIIQDLRLKSESSSKLHPRIVYSPTYQRLQIGTDGGEVTDDTEPFLDLLKNSNNNFLIHDVFLCLIYILGNVQSSGDNFLSEYEVSEEDLPEVLHRKFFKKLSILEPLQEMIQWKSLHTQLNEKPKEVLEAIKEVLEKNVNALDEQMTIIFFSIFKELIGKVKDEDQRNQIRKEVMEIKERCNKPQLREQIEMVLNVKEEIPTVESSQLEYDDAMKLLRSSEVYCKVYGSDTLVKLVKRRDEKTLLNRHTILAAAMSNLKQTESYAYLNVIRLLTALSLVMDSEVIEALIAEYKNEELEIDERLKLGEVVIKVTEALGPFSVKFKDLLINCFLRGSRDGNNEFRTSSLANLGTVCKLLTYEIHSFFHEMLQQLENVIKNDEYLPSKRAAAMVLSEVLAGLPNLLDFQDFLLPIYHLLKDVIATEVDHQTKLHAGVGLDHLNAKTKDFLNPDLKAAKEIKIQLDEHPNKLNEIKFK